MEWHATWPHRKQALQALWLAQQPSRTGPGLLVSLWQTRIEEIINRQDGSKTQLQAIVETAVDGIITINDRGLIETFNPAAEKFFGYRAKAILGKPVSMLMPEPYRSEHAHYVNHYLKTGEKRIIGIGREVVGRRKDGSTFPMFLSVGEQRGNGGKKFTGIVRDITDRKRTESQ
ncbi:MAG: PAS domain S-box protein, partial [Phycisphaerae bacterium]